MVVKLDTSSAPALLNELDNFCGFILERQRKNLEYMARRTREYAPRSRRPNIRTILNKPQGKQKCHRNQNAHTFRAPREQDEYIVSLASRLDYIPRSACGAQYKQIQRAIIHVAFARYEFELVRDHIRCVYRDMPLCYYSELEAFYYEAAYALKVSTSRITHLSAVHKYRIRKKDPCPTIELIGRRRYNISEKASARMEEEFKVNPSPDRKKKEEISSDTGASLSTVSNWFKNRRQRVKRMFVEQEDVKFAPNAIPAASDKMLEDECALISEIKQEMPDIDDLLDEMGDLLDFHYCDALTLSYMNCS